MKVEGGSIDLPFNLKTKRRWSEGAEESASLQIRYEAFWGLSSDLSTEKNLLPYKESNSGSSMVQPLARFYTLNIRMQFPFFSCWNEPRF
jgi:hypothetical protein